QDWTFDEMSEHLNRGIAEQVSAAISDEERPLLAEEVKVGCTQTMLLCLDRPRRLAYILADIFLLDDEIASRIIGLDRRLFGALVESARARLHAFMVERCGIINPACSCRCSSRLGRD